MNDKYKLVPIYPTPEMIHAGQMAVSGFPRDVLDRYQAMLAAAPEVGREPVVWIIRHPRFCGKFTDDKEIAAHWENKEQGCTVPLYLHPQPAPDMPGLTEALRQYQHNDGSGLVLGYDKLLVDRYVAGLVEALEYALETMENVDGANDCSRGIDAVEEALAAYRKQGGES